MATLELERTQVLSEEAQQHNAMIGECYRRLLDVEYGQISNKSPVRASVLAPEKPAFVAPPAPAETMPTAEQMPQITEYVPKRMDTPVFTTDKFQAVPEMMGTPVMPVQPVGAPVEVYAPSAVQEAEYMLTGKAKTVFAVFMAVVCAMITMICVNSYVIRQKTVHIQNLEQRKQELLVENEELQRRLENAKSDETIEEYAKSQGMILAK